MTSDKNYLGKGNIDKFDALFFQIRSFDTDYTAKLAVPDKRSPHQRYILSSHESARRAFVNEKYMSK